MPAMIPAAEILKFMDLLQAFRRVERVIYALRDKDRLENDVEHSWQLAMLAWFFLRRGKFELELDKVLRYALVHDLVEVYAGDVFAYDKSGRHDDKARREQEAAERLKKEFPELGDLHETIAAYEKKADREARFVYALDKLEPAFHNYADNGRIWKKHDVTLTDVVDYKRYRVALAPELLPYLDELQKLLKNREQELFKS